MDCCYHVIVACTNRLMGLYHSYIWSYVSRSYIRSFTLLSLLHISSLSVPDFTPNVGLFWYFFTDMFEHFRLFFLCVLQINAFIHCIPFTIRFR